MLLLSPPGSYGGLLAQQGFRWIEFPLSRGVNPLSELATLLRVIGLYLRERPDIAHHFTIKCVLYGGIAARCSRAKAIVSSVTGLGHIFITNSWRNRALRPLLALAYRFVFGRSQVIFQNPDDLEDFRRLGLIGKARSHLIRGSGVDTARFVPAARSKKGGPLKVLMVGRLLLEKGVREFVDAARLVRTKLPDTSFSLAGGADPNNPSSIDERVIAEWKRKGDVSFLGHTEEVRDLLQAADLVVLPSYREGAPLSLIEAAACGLPLVATDVPGCREVVLHKVNGLLVPPKNSQLLSEAIVELLLDPERRRAMGGESRKLACEVFAQDRVIRETMDVYSDALAR